MVISIDVQSAFDSAQWFHILSAMKKKRVPRNLYKLTRSYLSERHITAQVGDISVTKDQTQGVCQGSLARSGPILWNILYDHVVSAEVGALKSLRIRR